MANSTLTLAQLVGTGGHISLERQRTPIEEQEFAFAGIAGVYITKLGARGRTFECRGDLRATGANAGAAGLALTAVIEAIEALDAAGTIFDLFHSESTTAIYKLYVDSSGSDMKNLIVQGFGLTSPRYFVAGGLTCIVDYEMTLRRIGP